MKIILYTTNCPKCRILEAKLNNKKMEYKIETNIDEMLAKGLMSAPGLEVDGQLLDFVAANKWINEQ